jgi:acetoin utilization deacetylase AcuC-like enzyme
MSIAFISHPDCLLHEMGKLHPEAPARLDAIEQALIEKHTIAELVGYEAPLATHEQLLRVHDAHHLNTLLNYAPKMGYYIIDSDTVMNPYTLSAALRAAGAAVLAVDLIMAKQHSAAFCNVRPPGHHAEKGQAMGFCFFNNVAVGVAHALEHYHLQRVAIVDFDVHHGNGTESIFKEDERVLLCSSFQYPFYPFTDVQAKNTHILKMPLPAGTRSSEFQQKIKAECLPKLTAFKPELIFFSAGFDAHVHDPLANLALTEADYEWITLEVKKIAHHYAEGRLISCLEGGYHLSALGDSAAAHIKAML